MASGSPTILKEFLVALGFKVDDQQFRNFETKFKFTIEKFAEIGKVAVAAGAALSVAITKTASDMEKLYYVSQRTGASVANLQALRFGAEQIGVSADQATNAVEGLAAALRLNPGKRGLLTMLGIQEGTDNAQTLLNLVSRLRQMPFFMAAQFAGQFGIDERTLFMLEKNLPEMVEAARQQKKFLSDAGVDSDKLAADSHAFMQDVRTLIAHVSVLALLFEQHILPTATKIVHFLTSAVDAMIALDKATGGWSTTIGGIVTALGGVVASMSVIRGLAGIVGIGGGAGAAAGGAGAAAGAGIGGALATGGLLALDAGLAVYDAIQLKKLFTTYSNSAVGDSVRGMIAKFEGFSSKAYKDARGFSIGFGHFIQPGENFSGGISRGDALKLLAQDTKIAADAVHRLVKVSLNANQIAALTDFVYNIGATKFSKSTLLKDINSGDLAGAAEQFQRWNKVFRDGRYVTSDDLTSRRLGEKALFNRPEVNVNQKTDIHVSGVSDPKAAAIAVSREQTRVNGDLVRNMGGAAVQ